jgi:U3 small nucleolar RNA-associated protein 14
MDRDADEEAGEGSSGPLGRQTQPGPKGKGLAGMKFMTKAATQQRAAARSEAESLLRELAADTEQLSSGEEDESDVAVAAVAQESDPAPAPAMMGGTLEVARRSMPKKTAVSGNIGVTPAPKVAAAPTPPAEPVAEANPWLDPSAGRPAKRKTKGGEGADVGLLDTQRAATDALSGTEHEPRPFEGQPPAGKGKTLSQAALVARAFASPDFAAEFASEQVAAEERAKPPPVDSNGWGSWAGMGAEPKPAAAPPSGKRKREGGSGDGGDSGSANAGKAGATSKALPLVVVSTKRVKGQARLKVAEVPYPFTSREQYERSLAVPVGKEWNAMRAARGFARPNVITDAGRAIAPIKLPKKSQHQAPFAKKR